MSTAITTMTDKERREYRVRKESIKQGIIGVAEDLKYIRDERLYREEYGSFENFVKFEFEKTKQWAYQLICHSEVLTNLKSAGSKLQTEPTVGHSQQLSPLPDEEQPEVWESAMALARRGGRTMPTVSDLKSLIVSRKNKTTGYVYIIFNGYDSYKIGHTYRDDVTSRLNEMQTANARMLSIVACLKTNDPRALEVKLQNKYRAKRTLQGGREWYALDHNDIQEIIVEHGSR